MGIITKFITVLALMGFTIMQSLKMLLPPVLEISALQARLQTKKKRKKKTKKKRE